MKFIPANMIKFILILFIYILSTVSYAQQTTTNPPESFWNNVRFGGGIGLGFGNGFFSASLAPSAIYQFNPSFALGVGLNGSYASSKDVYKSTIYGGSILGLLNPIRDIQLSAEFEELRVNRNFDDGLAFQDQNYWYPALFLGAGYNTGNVVVGMRYDILYDDDKSIYSSAFAPFFRVYF